MKSSILLCALVCFVLRQDVTIGEKAGRIVEYRNERTDNGYYFKFATDDGQVREERGELITKNGAPILSVRGLFSYISSDKKRYITHYVADEFGYRTQQEVKSLIPKQAVSVLAGGGFNISILS